MPFHVDKEAQELVRIIELSDGTLASSSLSNGATGIAVRVRSQVKLSTDQKSEISGLLAMSLRVEEELSGFYAEARRHKQYRWIPETGSGRLLRAPTVFEDVVKMICTTNCSWALTTVMIENLTKHLGRRFADGAYSFPTPEALAGTTEHFLRKNIRAGYRSPYLIELADGVVSGRIDLESWRTSPLTTVELFEKVKSIKGVGDYAAGNLLKLLGRYDYLGLDSWVRSRYYDLHTRGRKVSDRTIERRYESYGTWRGLFFWLEMTKHWFDHKFPF